MSRWVSGIYHKKHNSWVLEEALPLLRPELKRSNEVNTIKVHKKNKPANSRIRNYSSNEPVSVSQRQRPQLIISTPLHHYK